MLLLLLLLGNQTFPWSNSTICWQNWQTTQLSPAIVCRREIGNTQLYALFITLLQSNKRFTHVKEAAGMFQYQLTGVWFVLTVIHIYMEFISLEWDVRGENNCLKSNKRLYIYSYYALCSPRLLFIERSKTLEVSFILILIKIKGWLSPRWQSSGPHPLEAAHSSPAPSGKYWKHTHTQMQRAEDHDLHLIFFLYGSAVFFLFFEAEHLINPNMFLHYKKGCIVLYCIVLSPVGFFKVWLQESKISWTYLKPLQRFYEIL